MYYIFTTTFALASILYGWSANQPALVLIGGAYLGHALTEALNDPTK